MKKISPHLSLLEVTKSNTADRNEIDNNPNEKQLVALTLISEKVFEPLRRRMNHPIGISSGFRSLELNKVLKGSKTSQHCKGEALDLDADIYGGITNAMIFNFIKDNLDFDQLIWEYGDDDQPNWVHVSYKAKGNRKKVLRAVKGKGYIAFK